MNQEEMKTLATGIIEAGFAAGKTEDDMKIEMFGAKIPFSKLNTMFKNTAITLGLLVDPKVITDGINELVPNIKWTEFEQWSDVEEQINNIVNHVDGATPGRALTLVRAYCKDEEIELPAKPKGAGTGAGARAGKISVAIVNLINGNETVSKQDFYDAIFPLVGGEKQHSNTHYYQNIFLAVCLAVKGNVALAGVTEDLNKQINPAGLSNADVSEVEVTEEDEELVE